VTGKSAASRVAAYRQRRKQLGEPDTTRRNAKEFKRENRQRKALVGLPFVGCDGEGCGVDDKGRQLFMLFRVGEQELYTGEPLSTREILDFICDTPPGQLLVGFAFGYDVTMILRDLPEAQLRRLFAPKLFGEGKSRYVWYKEFDIEYLPKQYFRVRRVSIHRYSDGREKREPDKSSCRTIYETFGFFQKSFLKSIETFDVGTKEEREEIAAEKDRRSSFTEITQRERDYCEKECIFLAELMEKLREYCHAAGIYPHSWNGAGKLAAALHLLHETPRATDINSTVPRAVLDWANMAYYGGRFEITRVGHIKQKVYEYDIHSAYPAAMRNLPCLIHGTWKRLTGKALVQFDRDNPDGLFVASCKFKSGCENGDRFGRLGGLPIRSKEGHLYWPLNGMGVYWATEIRSARRLGSSCKLVEGWAYIKNCDCHPFEWIEPLFEYRKSIGSQGAGYPIKLGINSLYGKLAQRKGNGAFCNMIWAGLITARTRSMINEAIALDPSKVVMCATDAVYTLAPFDIDVGEKLGQWECKVLPDLFIVQPGLYWSPKQIELKYPPEKRKQKSRGLSGKFFENFDILNKFQGDWGYFYDKENSQDFDGDFPAVAVPVTNFIGLRVALARNKPELAGTWMSENRSISFDYRNKRCGHIREGGNFLTGIKPGYAGLVSLPHRDFLAAGGQEPWEAARLMLEDQPDYVDLGIPFKD